MPKLTVKELGYLEEMRMRLGLDELDTSRDSEIENMRPMERVRLIAGWVLGDGAWADSFAEYFESQGLFLTDKNPETDND